MSLPSDGYIASKPKEYEFRVMGLFVSFILSTFFPLDIVNGTWTLNSRFAQIANFTTMRLELRIGVFDFNGWSADQPIGKVNSRPVQKNLFLEFPKMLFSGIPLKM